MNVMSTHRALRLHRRLPHCRRWSLACLVGLAIAGTAQADVVTDWNATAGSVVPRFGGPQQQSRVMAMTHIAIHDALNSIDRRYEPYSVVSPANANASANAAVAAAARKVLLDLLAPLPTPTQAAADAKAAAIASVNAAFAATLGPGAYSAAEVLGIGAGEHAANAILSMRTGDGSATPNLPYTLAAGPGVYQPTPNPEFPDAIVPANAGWAYVTPFALRHNQQFMVEPGALFNVTSAAYASNYNEVVQVGNALVRAAAPDSAQSDIARFWPGGGSNWNLTARVIASGRGLDAWQHARLFALLNIAETDALIANLYAKYTFNFWRPVTAIRWSNDGNPATASDPAWRPFLVTPPYPDYPCALPSATGASTEVLHRYFGTDDIAFDRSFNAPAVALPAPLAALPPKTINRHFDSLSQAAAESVSARVYAGIHFREGCVVGQDQGNKVGRFVIQHYLRPLKAK